MSYESEQKQYAEDLELLKGRYEELKQFFADNPDKKENKTSYLNGRDYGRMQYEQILEKKYDYYDHRKYSTLYLEFLILGFRKSELEYNLKQSKVSRGVEKTVDFIGGITPQHVAVEYIKLKMAMAAQNFVFGSLLLMR